jgi:hypothetical protein
VADTPYATVDQLRRRLNSNAANVPDSYNVDLQDALNTAAADVEADTGGRQFYLDDVASARIFDPAGRVERTREGFKLLVDDFGILDLIVEVGDPITDTWTAVTNFLPGPENALAKGRPFEWVLRAYAPWTFSRLQRVRVTTRWGWPVIPQKATFATLLRAQRLFRRSGSPEGLAGFVDSGGMIRLSRYDSDYDKAIASLMTFGFGA